MKIIKQASTINTTYFPGRNIKWIVIHYTAGASSRTGSAINTALWFGNPAAGGSADFVVDDTQIVQFSPDIDNYYCWHAGVDYSGGTAPYHGKCTNANSIGIEICCNNSNYTSTDPANSPKWSFTSAAIARAIELTKYLMQKYNIPADHVIRHWDVCRKPCPGVIGWNTWNGSTEEKWLDFKKQIGSTTTSTVKPAQTAQTSSGTIYRVQCGAFSVKSNANSFCDSLHKKGFKDAYVVEYNGVISDIRYYVQCGAFSVKSNAEALKTKLQTAGVKDAFITTSNAGAAAKKTVDELAKEVIAGKWGNGDDRKKRLTAAGYDAAAVQAAVNKFYGG